MKLWISKALLMVPACTGHWAFLSQYLNPVSPLHCGLFRVSTHPICPLVSLSVSWDRADACSITLLRQQADHELGLGTGALVRFSRSDQLRAGVCIYVSQSLLKWSKQALYLYDDSSPAVARPAVVWVCVVQASCLSCPGQAPGAIWNLAFVLFEFLTVIDPLAKLFTRVEPSFAPCSTFHRFRNVRYLHINTQLYFLFF